MGTMDVPRWTADHVQCAISWYRSPLYGPAHRRRIHGTVAVTVAVTVVVRAAVRAAVRVVVRGVVSAVAWRLLGRL